MEIDESADLVGEMAPRNENNPTPNKSSDSINEIDECDLAEMESVNESLDELSSALDFIEQRTDNIMAQLKELLQSNREIRQSLAEENIVKQRTCSETK